MTAGVVFFWALVVGGVGVVLAAGGGTAGDGGVTGGGGGEGTARVEGLIAEVEGAAGLDDAVRSAILGKLQGALEDLREAGRFRGRAEEFRQWLSGGGGVSGVEEELLEEEPEAGEFAKDSLSSMEGALGSLRARERELDGRYDELIERSPKVLAGMQQRVREGLAGAKAELDEWRERVAGRDPGLAEQAEQEALRARVLRHEAELEMLGMEMASYSQRMSANQSGREALRERIRSFEEGLNARKSEKDRALVSLAREARELSRRAEDAEDPPSDEAARLRGRLETLSLRADDAIRLARETDDLLRRYRMDLEMVRESFQNARAFLEHEETVGLFATEIFDRLLAIRQHYGKDGPADEAKAMLHQARKEIYEVREASFADGMLRDTERGGVGAAGDAVDLGGGGEVVGGGGELEGGFGEIERMREVEQQLVETLLSTLTRVETDLMQLQVTQGDIRSLAAEFREYMLEKLFLVRSSPSLFGEDWGRLPEAVVRQFGSGRAKELVRALGGVQPFGAGVLLLAVFVLGFLRPRLLSVLKQCAKSCRRVSGDSYKHSMQALVATVLLALPLPLLLGGLSRLLAASADATAWTDGLAQGMGQVGLLFVGLVFMDFCRPQGLGESHIGWSAPPLRRMRRIAGVILPVVYLGSMLVVMVGAEQVASHLNTLGRILLIALSLAIGLGMAAVFHPNRGIAAAVHQRTPASLFGRARHFAFYMILAVTASFVLLLGAGYVVTVLLLIRQVEHSLFYLLLAFLLYGMLLRLFVIRERKMKLQEWLEERRSRREASSGDPVEAAQEPEPEASVLSIDLQEEEPMDLRVVKVQNRRLIGFVVGALLLAKLWGVWTELTPVVNILDGIKMFGGVSGSDIAVVVLIILLSVAVIRNLPGILHALLFSRMEVPGGTRNAIVTLAQYGVVAVGFALLYQQLGIDWAQFAWIAAALGVGIGFGLQEVVANFISGLILLFERQVRPGDVVTVDNIDGIVSRIQIRATTITGWDWREYVVPNKNFVTGTFLNWTLSSPVNRALIVVGVAYGSDTELAREILCEVAAEHPCVAEDPAPMATFEEFGDSALKLVLRAYLPNLDNRLRTISDLHTAIDRRFKEAGIVIAFPQLDLHLHNATRSQGGESS